MGSYFSTFITGLGDAVAAELVKRLKNVGVELLTDGLVIYKTVSPPDEIKKLQFLNNSFILLQKFENIAENMLDEMMRDALKDPNVLHKIAGMIPRKNLTFRIRASVKNQFVAVDKILLKNLEKKLFI